MKGDKGDPGPQGPMGPQGPPGLAGLAGSPGALTSTISSTTVLGPAVYDEPEGAAGQGPVQPKVVSAGTLEWSTCYYALFGGERALTGGAVEEALGDAGVVTRFTVGINGSPGTGTWTFTLMRGDKALLPACTISGTNRTCSSTGYAPISSIDRLSIQMNVGTGDNTPANLFSTASFQVKYVVQ